MSTRVVNIANTPDWNASPGYVYIGRQNRSHGLKGSRFANPFRIATDGTREAVIAKFRDWVCSSADTDAVYIREHVHELRGKTLVCWCAPAACHGDVLAELAELVVAAVEA